MTGWRRVLRDLVLIALALVLYFLVPLGEHFDRDAVQRGLVSVVCIVAAGALVLWQVLRQVEDPDRRVDALLLSMVVGVLVFALAFYRLSVEDPDQFVGMETRVDALYFTMSTLLTVGFGDIHAEGQVARVFVLLQMLFNVIVLATAATTLNSRVRQNAQRRAEARREAQERSTQRKPT